MPVQSKTAFLVMRPMIFVGRERDVKFSVKAREVARVPPRKDPYIRMGRWIGRGGIGA